MKKKCRECDVEFEMENYITLRGVSYNHYHEMGFCSPCCLEESDWYKNQVEVFKKLYKSFNANEEQEIMLMNLLYIYDGYIYRDLDFIREKIDVGAE